MSNYIGGVHNRRKRALARLEKSTQTVEAKIKELKEILIKDKKESDKLSKMNFKSKQEHEKFQKLIEKVKTTERNIPALEKSIERQRKEIATLKTRI